MKEKIKSLLNIFRLNNKPVRPKGTDIDKSEESESVLSRENYFSGLSPNGLLMFNKLVEYSKNDDCIDIYPTMQEFDGYGGYYHTKFNFSLNLKGKHKIKFNKQELEVNNISIKINLTDNCGKFIIKVRDLNFLGYRFKNTSQLYNVGDLNYEIISLNNYNIDIDLSTEFNIEYITDSHSFISDFNKQIKSISFEIISKFYTYEIEKLKEKEEIERKIEKFKSEINKEVINEYFLPIIDNFNECEISESSSIYPGDTSHKYELLVFNKKEVYESYRTNISYVNNNININDKNIETFLSLSESLNHFYQIYKDICNISIEGINQDFIKIVFSNKAINETEFFRSHANYQNIRRFANMEFFM